MKSIVLVTFVFFISFSQAQNLGGVIEYEISNHDTVLDVINLQPDTILYTYSFQGNNSNLQYGTSNLNESILINEQGSFILSNNYTSRSYSITGEAINLDSLKYAFDTTEMKFEVLNEMKILNGYNCKKIRISALDLSNGYSHVINSYYVWFTDEVHGNHYLPLFIGDYPCTNGLILEYIYPAENGYTNVTAKSVVLQNVAATIFHPNFSTYNLIYSGN
jgi:GLPGLI family protein